MLLTLTLNPALDQTAWIERLVPGTVHHALRTHVDPGGKGINVSRMAHRLGWPTVAFGFVAGEIGDLIERSLDHEQVEHQLLRLPGETRVNTKVVDQSTGTTSSFNGPGPSVSPENLAALSQAVRLRLVGARGLVLAGSALPGAPADVYASYIRAARERGVPTFLDTHGAPLRAGLEAKPDFVKPNLEEAEELLGRRLPDDAAIVRAVRELASRAGTVVLSMGARGAVCVQGQRGWRAIPPKVEAKSQVGAGDALVAGLAVALARGQDLVDALRLGTAAGAATAMTEGTGLGTAGEVEALLKAVRIEELG